VRKPRPEPLRIWAAADGYERLEAELRAFLDGRDRWPTEAEFKQAGHYRLYQAARRRGGTAYWAGLLGVPHRKRGQRPPRAPGWDDTRLQVELAAYLDERQEAGLPPWPAGPDEWLDDGRSPLYWALARSRPRGLSFWKARTLGG
jgi:hypothetical protein